MAKISDVEIPSLLFAEQASDPAIPASGYGRLFVKSDGVYFIDDAGTVTGPLGAAGGGGGVVSAETTLTTTTPGSTAYVQWGTEEAVIAQADAPAAAVVLAWLSGMMGRQSGDVGDRGQVQMEVSFDGGSTWADFGGEMAPGLVSTDANIRVPFSRQGRATGTVTGDIQVRAKIRDVDLANDVNFDRGRILVEVHAQ